MSNLNQNQQDLISKRVDHVIGECLGFARPLQPTLYADMMNLVEKQLIKSVLQHYNNNQVHTAKLLGIHRNSVKRIMHKYGIPSKQIC